MNQQNDSQATDRQIDKPVDPQLSRRGPIAWFSANHVAANLVMLFFIIAGLFSLMRMKIEIFPELDPDMVTVQVPYLGASPAEVEEGVCIKVEEAIAGVEGIKELRSLAFEGVGVVTAEINPDANDAEVLDDIKNEVDRIDTFPEQTEQPIISEAVVREQTVFVTLWGDVPEKTLKYLAEQVRDELTALQRNQVPGPAPSWAVGPLKGLHLLQQRLKDPNPITQVNLTGDRPFEISIEVSEQNLRRHGLSFDQVAAAVGRSSLDLPGGSIETEGGEILIRTKGQKYRGYEFEDIVVLTRSDGTKVYLNEVASIIDGFEDTDVYSRFNGHRAVSVRVFRIGDQNALDVADVTRRYVEAKKNDLPEGVNIDVWLDRSVYLKGRMNLLLRNAAIGLVLVFCCLLLFLDARLAFWTTMGIPMSFMGAFVFLPWMDVSVNMISLFAFIVVLGIVVDDAIVVGENIFAYRQKGLSPLDASIKGAREMAMPVTLAVLTTIAAFAPLYFTAGDMGKILRIMPLVVISVLALSLVESLWVLPAHLNRKARKRKYGPLGQLQSLIRRGLDWVIQGPYQWLARQAVAARYLTICSALAVLVLVFGLVRGGIIKFDFFPPVESDYVVAALTMAQGTPADQTEHIVEQLENAAFATLDQMTAEVRRRHPDAPRQYKHISTTIGNQPFSAMGGGGPGARSGVSESGGHLAEIIVELLASEQRQISAKEMENRWRKRVQPDDLAGASELTIESSIFSSGEPINYELSHRNFDTLIRAADLLKQRLAQFSGVFDIRDSFQPGKVELKLELTDAGRTLGLTLEDLARQVRSGFYGFEVQRVQRGRDDIKVMVRYPNAERASLADIHNMRIRSPGGIEAPFNHVAKVTIGRGYATIDRADRRRIVAVKADVDRSVAIPSELNKKIKAELLPELTAEFPGLLWDTAGEDQEQQESLNSLMLNFIGALLLMFALLAIQFRSYFQPLIIMSAIPFGVVGAALGHVVMGYNLTLLSLFGIVALAGVVVNDSLILIDLINRQRAEGVDKQRAVVDSAMRRFRPILLTTLTTFFGLMPMILERSLQAKFLVPMAISLGFGVLFATMITLLLVPAFYMVLEDLWDFLLKPMLVRLGLADEQATVSADVKPEPA
jgi:multidrug efflux pump subunit AcrB